MSVLEGPHDLALSLINPVSRPAHNSNIRGLDILLKASYPEATHESFDHPDSCFPGTREQHIEDITGWARSPSKPTLRMMWLHGFAGVGKSSLAQSCAEGVGSRLAAAFFFSRPNKRDKPTRFFTSIAYQLTTRYPSYRNKMEEKIRNDPTLVEKSVVVQFRELIVAPIEELRKEGRLIKEGVIFIDGLDECAGEDAQCTIIDVITASVRDQTTPFIWAIFSRPEPHITAQFSAPHIRSLCWQLTLPVSRDADGEIELYLRGAFRQIRTQYGFPSSIVWPSEGDIRELVDRSAGLFVYPSSIVRYVGKRGALGPEGRLRLVIRHTGKSSGNLWWYLDAFYSLIMEQISKETLAVTLKLLLSYSTLGYGSLLVAAAGLGFSETTFITTLSKLHSVIRFPIPGEPLQEAFTFYHASFTDFLNDPVRSDKFYVRTPELCAALLGDLITLYSRGVCSAIVHWRYGDSEARVKCDLEENAIFAFWELGPYAKLDESLLKRLSEMDYRQMGSYVFNQNDAYRFFKNIPPAWRPKIMRPYYSALWQKLFRRNKPALFPFVLGNGENRNVLVNYIGHKKDCCFLGDYRRFGYMGRRTLKWKIRVFFRRLVGKEENFEVLVKGVGDLIELDTFQQSPGGAIR